MSDERLIAVKSLLRCIEALEQSRPLASQSKDVYRESIDKAVGSIFEFVSALLAELGAEQRSECDPFHDFGQEPLNKPDAIKLASSFASQCQSLLEGPTSAAPFTAMYVRCQTFACQFLN